MQMLTVLLILCSFRSSVGQSEAIFSVFASNSSSLVTASNASIHDALRLALREDLPSISDDNLTYDTIITMCNADRAQEHLDSSNSGSLVAFLDGSCSTVAESLMESKGNLAMVVYSSTSAVINNDTDTSMGTFRTIPSDREIPPALSPLFDEFGWSQMSVVTETEGAQYRELSRLISDQYEDDDLSIVEVTVNRDSVQSSINTLFDAQPHVFFLNTDIPTGIQFLCEGYARSRYYPNYLWILPGWWYQVGVATQWWDDPSLLTGVDCDVEDMRRALNRSLVLRPIPAAGDNDEMSLFDTDGYFLDNNNSYSTDKYAADAVLALSLALNRSTPAGTYAELTAALSDVEFFGASGSVSFNSNGDRANSQLLIQQIRFDTPPYDRPVVDVAITNTGSNVSLLLSVEEIFPDGIPPDGTPLKVIYTIHYGVTVAITILCIVGLALAIVCLLFNIVFKDKKIVKLTSPNLNYFLLAGVMALLIGMVFYVIGTTNIPLLVAFCSLRRILVSIGHDIGFTVAVVKTWRIHYIFRNPSPNKRAPKDWQLFAIASLIVSIDIIGSIALFIPDIIFNDVGFSEDKEIKPKINDEGILVEYCAPSCGTTPFYLVWIGYTFLFKMALHVAAFILWFRIRKIVVDTLNDFKFTVIIIYTSTVLIVVLVIVLVALVNYINVYGVMVPFLVFLEVLVFLLFTFVPKMVALYKDPQGLHVFDKPHQQHNSSVISDSLKRNVSLSYYNRKDSTIKDEGADSGRCTFDSKDQKENLNNIKEEDDVFVKNGDIVKPTEELLEVGVAANEVNSRPRTETDV